MTLSAFTRPELIALDLRSHDAAGAINELTQLAHRAGVASDSLAFYNAALNREFLAPTHVSSMVAFPHARSQVANRLAFAVGRSRTGIAWGPRGESVKLVFLIAIPPSSSGEYLGLMSAFVAIVRDSVLRQRLIEADDASEILAILGDIHLKTAGIQRATAEIDR